MGGSPAAIELSNAKAFEAALALVEATGVKPGAPFDVTTAEQAEQTAVYWLARAVEMRREEEVENEKQTVIAFIEDVYGQVIEEPTENDYKIYRSAVEWVKNRDKREPRTLEYKDAKFADKSVTWISQPSSLTKNPLEFSFSEEKNSWFWIGDALGKVCTEEYSGEHLGKLLRDYFPMTEKMDD